MRDLTVSELVRQSENLGKLWSAIAILEDVGYLFDSDEEYGEANGDKNELMKMTERIFDIAEQNQHYVTRQATKIIEQTRIKL